VDRDLSVPSLRALLPGQAYVAGTDGHLFFSDKREWVVHGSISASHLQGTTDAISRLQREPQRYYQRPDATHVELDPSATTMNGWTGSVNLNRNGGVHGLNAALWGVSPGFDSSDAGFTFASDRAGMHVVYQYRNPRVTSHFRNRVISFSKFY